MPTPERSSVIADRLLEIATAMIDNGAATTTARFAGEDIAQLQGEAEALTAEAAALRAELAEIDPAEAQGE